MKNNEKEVFEACKYKCPIPIPSIKKGDVLFCQSPTTIWLCIVSHIEGEKVYYYANYNITAKLLNLDDWFLVDYIRRKATPEEEALMIKGLENNKLCWIESDKILIQKNKVYDIIGLIKIHTFTDVGGSQQLVASMHDSPSALVGGADEYGLFCISTTHFQHSENCKIIPCRYSDLKPKDLVLRIRQDLKLSEVDICMLGNYAKILTKGYVFLDGESIIKSYNIQYQWYKVIKG